MSKDHLFFNDGKKDSDSECAQKLNNPFNNVLNIIPEQISNESIDNSHDNSNSRNNLYNEESSFAPNPAFSSKDNTTIFQMIITNNNEIILKEVNPPEIKRKKDDTNSNNAHEANIDYDEDFKKGINDNINENQSINFDFEKYNIEKEIIDDKLDMNNSLLFDQNEYNKMISELNRDKNSHIFQEKINDKSSIFHEHEENTNEIYDEIYRNFIDFNSDSWDISSISIDNYCSFMTFEKYRDYKIESLKSIVSSERTRTTAEKKSFTFNKCNLYCLKDLSYLRNMNNNHSNQTGYNLCNKKRIRVKEKEKSNVIVKEKSHTDKNNIEMKQVSDKLKNSHIFPQKNPKGNDLYNLNKNHLKIFCVEHQDENSKENKKKINEEIKKKRDIVKARITEPTKLGDIEKYLYREFKDYLKKNKDKFNLKSDFWDAFFATKRKNDPILTYILNGEKLEFFSYSHELMILLFSIKETSDLYEKFLEDDDFQKYSQSHFYVYRKNFHKIYCEKYKESDLDLVKVEDKNNI